MTKEELATVLNGRQYRNEITPEIEKLAKENNLLIIFGASDDLCEFRGAISDEFGCYDGGTIECKDLPKPIEAVWDPPKFNCSWIYKTDMPHTEFKIYEDEELYCIGIVIDLNDVPVVDMQEQKHGKWIYDGSFERCSVCRDRAIMDFKTPYCPNCGAKMDGKEGET